VQKFTTVYDFHDFQTSINGDWAFKVWTCSLKKLIKLNFIIFNFWI
jgi:hypothetical protein